MKLFILLAMNMGLISGALAAEPVSWPETYRIVCGDVSHIVPFDPRDLAGTMHPVLEGAARRIADANLPGYYIGGLGYTMSLKMTESEFLGAASPLDLTLSCFARAAALGDVIGSSFSCSGFMLEPPVGLPNLNMALARMPLPGPLSWRSQMPSTVSLRFSQRITEGNSSRDVYTQRVRELTCTYSRE